MTLMLRVSLQKAKRCGRKIEECGFGFADLLTHFFPLESLRASRVKAKAKPKATGKTKATGPSAKRKRFFIAQVTNCDFKARF